MFRSRKSLPIFIVISTVLAIIGMGKIWGMNEVKPLIVLGMQQQSSGSKVYNVYVLVKNKNQVSLYLGLFEEIVFKQIEMSKFLTGLHVQDIVSDDKKIIKMVLLGSKIEKYYKVKEDYYSFVKIGIYANQQFTLETKPGITNEKELVYPFDMSLGINIFTKAIKELETLKTSDNVIINAAKAIVEMEKLKKISDKNMDKFAGDFERAFEKKADNSDGLSANDVTIFSSIVSALFNGLVGSVMHFLPQNKKTVTAKTAIWGASSWLLTHTWPFVHKKQSLTQKMCVGIAGAAGLYAGTKIMSRFCRYFK